MKKTNVAVCGLILVIVLSGCNNFFHNLIPPDGNEILSFTVSGQLAPAVIIGNTVMVTVERGTDVHTLIPSIVVSPRATIVPVTLDYVQAAFPGVNLVREAMGMYMTDDLPGYVHNLIRETPDFTIPPLNMPIDFSSPVHFFVISGQGTIRQYSVEIFIDDGEPRLLGLRFAKYDNAELVSDALCLINEADKTITAHAVYPAEMDSLSFALVPAFDILGERVEIDGNVLISGESVIQFNAVFISTQTKTVTVWRGGLSADYTLSIMFTEDPDSIRNITDFRFNRTDNTGIAANAVAAIVNTGGTGLITVQVFYSGAQPTALTPRFITPGTASVQGTPQMSGTHSHDFSQPLEYRVVSRNGQFMRTYTVRTEFINLTNAAPRMLSFRFSHSLNPELVQDTVGEIGDSAGLIMIDAYYGGSYPPETLTPEFTAEGLVTVQNSVQVSGASPQSFSRQMKYTVTNPQNPLLTRDYWVQVRLVRDTSFDAAITAFGFFPADNPGLDDGLIAGIDQSQGRISIFAPVGSGVTERIMYPRFTAAGIVSVDGIAQTSGSSGHIFDAPVTYTVVSANGLVSRSYTVDVRELKSTIFVNQNAVGMNDGTNWTDAFISLRSACEAAALFPDDVPVEIWIAAGTYRPGASASDYFPLTAHTSYIGGFAGGETAKSQRDIVANVTVVSGDLGGGVRSTNLFARFSGTTAQTVNGDIIFEDMSFEGAESAINVTMGSGTEARVIDSVFTALTIDSVNIQGAGNISVSGVDFSNCSGNTVVHLESSVETIMRQITVNSAQARTGTAINLLGSGNKTLEYISVNRYGRAASIGGSGDLNIDDLTMENITGVGLNIDNTVTGRKNLVGIDGRNISGNAVSISSANDSGAIALTDSYFESTGRISISRSINNITPVSILNTAIKESRATGFDSAVYLQGGNIIIESVTIDGVPNGAGINITGAAVSISGSTFDNCGTVYISNATSIQIMDTTITNVRSNNGLYADISGNITLERVTIDGVPNGRGMEVRRTPQTVITINNSSFKNTHVNDSGGGLYMRGGNVAGSSIGNLNIRDSIFENCKADIIGGAFTVENSVGVNFNIINTDFINCSARNGAIISNFGGSGTFLNCTFEHNDSLYIFDVQTSGENCMIGASFGTVLFENCRFINLQSNNTAIESYIFTRFSNTNTYLGSSHDLTIRNSAFTFKQGVGMGLYALNSGNPNLQERQLLDGVTIINNGSTQPILWLHSNFTTGYFQFRPNNVYIAPNGTQTNLTTQASIHNLGDSVVRRTNGAVATMVP